jgi:uncharacterized membrane protein YhaH (DUF805 family)
MELLLRPWRRAFDFAGRSTRTEYWLFVGQAMLLILAPIIVGVAAQDPGLAAKNQIANLYVALFGIATLACFVPGLAVAVRRLHDQDRSGAFLFLWFAPFGGLAILVFMLLEGSEGENLYGPNPRDDDTLAGMQEVFE